MTKQSNDTERLSRFKRRVDADPVREGMKLLTESAVDLGRTEVFSAILESCGMMTLIKVKEQMRKDGTIREKD